MSDEHNDDNCETCGRPLNESRDFKSLKDQLASMTTAHDTLKASALERTVKDAGFDPALGIVKRLAAEFTGDMDPDAFKAFAVAEGLTPVAPAQTDPVVDNAAQLAVLQAQGDALRNASTIPQGAPTVADQKRAALEAGNVGQLLDLELANYQARQDGLRHRS